MLLGTLGTSVLESVLIWKRTISSGDGTIAADHDLVLTHALKNFEIQKYYQNGPRFKMFLQKIMYLKKKKKMGHMQ